MNQSGESTKALSESPSAEKKRDSRVATLFNAAAALGTIVLLAAMGGPKIPKNQCD